MYSLWSHSSQITRFEPKYISWNKLDWFIFVGFSGYSRKCFVTNSFKLEGLIACIMQDPPETGIYLY